MSTPEHNSESHGDENASDQITEELRTQIAVLREENQRLREEYSRARKASYRRSASALLGVGCIAVLAGILLTGVRDVLIVLGAIGIFGGILTWYITPDRVLTVAVSESVYQAAAANGDRLREELGLQSRTIYAPTETSVRVIVPQHQSFEVPESISSLFLTADGSSRGIALTPTGVALVAEAKQMQQANPSQSLLGAVQQWGDAVVEQFEIADAVTVAESSSENRVVVSVDGSSFGDLTEFDHPVVSVLGCGLAETQESPIEVNHIDEATVAFEPVDG